jgi:hypothetical protein
MKVDINKNEDLNKKIDTMKDSFDDLFGIILNYHSKLEKNKVKE